MVLDYNRIMHNKIFKTGHSAAVTISPRLLKDAGLKLGDTVKMEITAGGDAIIVKKSNKESQLPLNLKIRPRLK